MDDRWPALRKWLNDPRSNNVVIHPTLDEVRRALAILDAVTAPGTEVFGIRRFPIDGEDGCWMPVDVALALQWGYARPAGVETSEDWQIALREQVRTLFNKGYGCATRLAARYEAATAPPPPKWETVIRELVGPEAHDVVAAVRAALAEEQGE